MEERIWIKKKITKVWVDDTHVYAMTETGLTANYAFSQWPKLAKSHKGTKRGLSTVLFWHTLATDRRGPEF